MKTDAQLKKDIEAELAWEPSINASNVGVALEQGVEGIALEFVQEQP